MHTGASLGSPVDVTADNKPRVLVVGAGFGGLSAVSALARRGFAVTLADRHIYSTFQPLLYQVATAGLAPSDVAYPLRGFARKHGARFRHGELARIDTAAQVAWFADGRQAGYDYLILATGVAAAFYGIRGAAAYSHGLYTLHDATTLRERLMTALEQLSLGAITGHVTVTIVGGGATGVELAGTLADLRNLALPASYPDIDRDRLHIRLVEQAPALLAPFRPPLREYARQQLLARGVDLRLNAQIKEITPDRIILASGEELPSDLTAWAAGVTGDAAGQGPWGLPRGPGGRLLVGPDLRVKGQDRVFAIGDIAVIEGAPLPSSPSPRCRWASTRPSRSGTCRRASPPPGSATTTRASWPPSAAGRPWSSWPRASGSAARWPGWPGSACTWSPCSATGTGSTR